MGWLCWSLLWLLLGLDRRVMFKILPNRTWALEASAVPGGTP